MTYTKKDRQVVVEVLYEIASYLEIDDDISVWEVRSYRGAAGKLENANPEVLENPEELDGIGSSISGTIENVLEDGYSPKLEDLQERLVDLSELTKVEGLGVKTAKKFYDEFGVEDLDDLKEAAEDGKLREVEGIGSKTEENILEEIKEVYAGAHERKDWSVAEKYHMMVQNKIEGFRIKQQNLRENGLSNSPNIGRVKPAGSFRRREDTVGDLDILVECQNGNKLFAYLSQWGEVDKILGAGNTKMSFRIDNMQIDIRVVPSDEFGACLQYFTGNTQHNVALRKYARKEGYTINEYGIFEIEAVEDNDVIKGKKVGGKNESEIYKTLGLRTPNPQDRTEEWVNNRT